MKRRRKYVVNSTVLLGLMSFLSYNACYAGRSVLSAIMPEMTQNSSFTNEVLGVWGSMFFLTYGLGQIINGIIGDRIKAKYMVFIGLFLSGFVIIASAWATSPSIGALCWGLCGFLLSMLWGPLSKLIAENTTQTTGRILMTSLSAASILGNMVAYLVASLASAKHEWKWALYITGILMIVTAAAWFVILHALEKKNKLHTIHRQSESFQTNKQLFHSLKQNAIIPMLAVAIINGIIRNAVAFWIPTYIAEKLHTPPATASAITSI
ncbi:MAG: MFS transporter, partial [Oscillospiraceae bacterium]